MTEFSFTLANGSVVVLDIKDPELLLSGTEEFEDDFSEADDILVAAIDKLLNREYTSGK